MYCQLHPNKSYTYVQQQLHNPKSMCILIIYKSYGYRYIYQ